MALLVLDFAKFIQADEKDENSTSEFISVRRKIRIKLFWVISNLVKSVEIRKRYFDILKGSSWETSTLLRIQNSTLHWNKLKQVLQVEFLWTKYSQSFLVCHHWTQEHTAIKFIGKSSNVPVWRFFANRSRIKISYTWHRAP